jgi:hypothetical protein
MRFGLQGAAERGQQRRNSEMSYINFSFQHRKVCNYVFLNIIQKHLV